MTKRPAQQEPLVRAGTQTPTFWLDESGSRATAGKCFVMAGIKTRHADKLQRQIYEIREHHQYRGEFKFSAIQDGNAARFNDLIDVLADSDVKLIAAVVDSMYNPFKGVAAWQGHAECASRIVIGNINKNEIGTVFMDGISTPPGVDLGGAVKRKVNDHFHATSVTTAVSLDSRANDLLQAADLVAGAVSHQRRGPLRPNSKGRVANYLANRFDLLDLSDQRLARVSIATLDRPRHRGRRPDLHLLPPSQRRA